MAVPSDSILIQKLEELQIKQYTRILMEHPQYGEITTVQAFTLLKDRPYGTYILRPSTSFPGFFAISFKQKDIVESALICITAHGFLLKRGECQHQYPVTQFIEDAFLSVGGRVVTGSFGFVRFMELDKHSNMPEIRPKTLAGVGASGDKHGDENKRISEQGRVAVGIAAYQSTSRPPAQLPEICEGGSLVTPAAPFTPAACSAFTASAKVSITTDPLAALSDRPNRKD